MISEKINNALNQQINKEFYSSYLYLSISAYLRESGLLGFARWTKMQAKEELLHGEKIFDFLIDRKGTVHLDKIEKPKLNFETPLELFEFIYEHEQSITQAIMCVAQQAEEECDRTTLMFIDWYINEQVEEEANVGGVLATLRLIGDDKKALLILDKDLAARTFVAPIIG